MSAALWFIGGYIIGAGVVIAYVEWHRARQLKRMQVKPAVAARDVYQPTRYPYPLDYEMRKRMVLRHIVCGKLDLEQAKEFLRDGSISVNEYRQSVAERAEFERHIQPTEPWPKK